jgi:hypothetical protein
MSQQPQQPNKFLDTIKQASQRFSSVVLDTGAKTMLKVRYYLQRGCEVHCFIVVDLMV